MLEEGNIKLYKWLSPLSLFYGLGIQLRNKLFDWNILCSKSYDIPILCVGNITVGGTGKTPHIEYLIRLLSPTYRIAILSRGYKRKTKGFVLADNSSTAKDIGDEPFQIKHKFPGITVAVDANRQRGIEKLMQLTPEIDIILLDDAFQHRYVTPSISILLSDFNRMIYEDKLMPYGRLREPVGEKSRAQIVIVTKCPQDIKPIDFRIISKRLQLYPYQRLYFTGLCYDDLVPVFPNENLNSVSIEDISQKDVLLITGIASPQPFIQYIQGFAPKAESICFPDHHNFKKKDIEKIQQKLSQMKCKGDSPYIIVTEKDAARLLHNPYLTDTLKQRLYYLPLKICFLQNQGTIFDSQIKDIIVKNRKNYIPQTIKTSH